MAEIRPFRGVRYDQSLVEDLKSVICPPYDIITPQMQQELYLRSEYNFVRLEYGRELPQDTANDNRYTRSAATLSDWLRQGILKVDQMPSIYLHDLYFDHNGREYRCRGISVCVRLEEWDKMVIHPHEGTLVEPKNDRLSLLWACQANTSPILALYEDEKKQVLPLLALSEGNEPVVDLSSVDGQGHRILAITEPGVVNQIVDSLANKSLYIADGHHRYESALVYQREKRTYGSTLSGNEAFNFVMMTLVDIHDPGLIILPPHRLVRGISKSILNELTAKLQSFFDIEELPLNMPDLWQRVDDILTGIDLKETGEIRLVLFGLAAEHLMVLRLRDFSAASRLMPYFHSELYKRLDVSIVDHLILEKLLGLSGDSGEAVLTYSYDKLDAVNRVLSQEYQLAFLINPIKTEVIKAIADANDRMPRKSTYFYPKLPAGLIFNILV